MIALLMPFILCFTVVASVSLGIFAAYTAVIGILHAFNRSTRIEPTPQRSRLVLVPTQNHASGD